MIRLQYDTTQMVWPPVDWVIIITAAIITLVLTALVFRWMLSVGRQIRQQDRLFELVARIAEQQGISRDEIKFLENGI